MAFAAAPGAGVPGRRRAGPVSNPGLRIYTMPQYPAGSLKA